VLAYSPLGVEHVEEGRLAVLARPVEQKEDLLAGVPVGE
jgi:hypothetical protein